MSNQPKWKRSIIQAKKLRGQSMGILFDRVKLLVEVFEDDQFREDNGFDDLDAASHLDAEVDDIRATGETFLTLRQLFYSFPERDQWTRGNLREMIAELYEKEKEERAKETPSRVPRRATIKELDEVTKRAEQAERMSTQLEKRLDETRKSYDELLNENRDIREQLAEAKGRIAELERVLNRQLQTA